MSVPLVAPVFLMPYPQNPPVCDYRSVVNASATAAIFERWVNAQPGNQNPPFVLYQLGLTNGEIQCLFCRGRRSSPSPPGPTGRGIPVRLHSATVRAFGSSATVGATRCH
jgi:hypothetical protein